MLSSQFVFVLCLVAPWVIIGSFSTPLMEKDVVWFPTDDGQVVKAILKHNPQLPVRAVEDNVDFWHYLIGEAEGRKVTPNCDQCISNFIKGAPLIVIAHGFGGGDHTGGLGTRVRQGFANRSEPVNMVFLDWSKLAPSPWYELAANNVKPVGEYTARMINFLVEQEIASLNDISFIGHSLGTHVANYVTANLVGGKLHRIIALDPALPLFGVKEDSERIDPTDGNFVNVYHTAMGTLLDGGLAFTEPRGHADFYPNSGKDQPGCPVTGDFGSCSHSRAYHYLGESISNPTAFASCKCSSWEEYDSGECACQDQAVMGWDTPITTRGIYYLRTNAASPYSQN